jgi:hypothetical protein
MDLLVFVLVIVIGGPIVKALAHRISRAGNIDPAAPELRRALQATEQRLTETEARLATVEEKLDFYEKLLANPERKTKTPEA